MVNKKFRLFAPWRREYILSGSDEKKAQQKNSTGCIFCDFPKDSSDEEHLIVHRSKYCFVILNAFPYNPGHLMVVPYRHLHDFAELTADELSDLMGTAQTAIKVMTKVMAPQGFNLGMNIGRTAGAGIDQHLHMHIVPRWNGDTNFMPVIGGVRVVSESNESAWKRLRDAWPKD